jgi:hypothetical protein
LLGLRVFWDVTLEQDSLNRLKFQLDKYFLDYVFLLYSHYC